MYLKIKFEMKIVKRKDTNIQSSDFLEIKGKGRLKLSWSNSGTSREKGHETHYKAGVVAGSLILCHQFAFYRKSYLVH